MAGDFSKLSLFSRFASNNAPLAWDFRGARRALVFSSLAIAVALLLTAATDEGDVAWLVRAGRTWPVIPICAAVGTWATLASQRARSERLALEALGRAPQKNAAGPVAAGILLSVFAGALLTACTRIDLQGYYPRIARTGDFVFDGNDFVDRERAIRVTKDGASLFLARDTARTGPDEAPANATGPGGAARAVAGLVTALTGIALTLLAACTRSRGDGPGMGGGKSEPLRAATAVILATLPTIFLFQAAAVSRSSRGIVLTSAIVPALSLLAYALVKYRNDSGESGRT